MAQTFRLKAVSAAVMAACMATPLYAAPEDKAASEEDVEVIEVTGFKASLQKAINAKRFANSVVDTIHAEDVGKSTDANIADALSRVTGVTVQESDGEGTRISVRGAGASLNQISMNGVALTGGFSGSDANEADNSVDLSAFSSDILSSIDVIKTAAADHDEGSLGANVILRTAKPLSFNNSRRNLDFQGRYNEFSGNSNYRLSGTISEKFFDETLGVILTVTDETQDARTDRVRVEFWNQAKNIGDNRSYDLSTYDAEKALAGDFPYKSIRVPDADGNAPADFDEATQVLIQESALEVIPRQYQDMLLDMNERDRFTLNAGIQWRASEDTELQLDFNHSELNIKRDNHRLRLNFTPNMSPYAQDPLNQWWGIDLENKTVDRMIGRHPQGTFDRTIGGQNIENDVATLSLQTQLTDNLKLDLKAGYSRTTDDTPESVAISTATWNTIGQTFVNTMDADYITPTGYDCTSGQCELFVGEKFVEYDPVVNRTTRADSRFTPHDLFGNHLGNIRRTENHLVDSNKSLFVDFDWDVDWGNIIKVEFGGKLSERLKTVDAQTTTLTSGARVVENIDGQAQEISSGPLQNIRMADILGNGAFPVNNFLEDLTPNRDAAFLQGWGLLDPFKAYELAFSRPAGTTALARNPAGSREIGQDTQALYGKVNFEFLDGHLTGNLGLRYVQTQVEAQGFSSIQYHNAVHGIDPYDLIINKELADVTKPICQSFNYTNGNQNEPDNFSAVASSGCMDWRLTHSYQTNNNRTLPLFETRIDPATGSEFAWPDGSPKQWLADVPTYDPSMTEEELLAEAQAHNMILWYDYSGDTPKKLVDIAQPDQVQFTDGSGSVTTNFGVARNRNPLIGWNDRRTTFFGPAGSDAQTTAFFRTSPIADESDYSVWLPSLNINYQLSDQYIGRFAMSKTMARPRFDSVNPRVQINESIWDAWGTGALGNTHLKPLESVNLDLSFERYWGDSNMMSVALFYKDMSNFEETFSTPYYYVNHMSDYTLPEGAGNPDNLLITPNGQVPGDESNCMPQRWVFQQITQPLTIQCHQVNINEIRNGKGAVTQGLELSYTQIYDFLPGALSGLGLSVNYTYADSESDAESVTLSETEERLITPLPQTHTPKHSSNIALFWEKNGHSLRLANRYNSIQLINRGLTSGAEWLDSTNRLDFSSNFKINNTFSITFHALNLTDDIRRTFYTSTRTEINGEVFDEGNAMDGGNTSRTMSEFKTGRNYRIGIRASF
ncbi:TonB-dependent receptor [Saccharobesus litoralis]|uniref:TonB-dependent receptor n=1 Tax=Saccharobesus litoralis TaxID=2172099 RepID=A0A2S0VNR9_9ALTE|nr:TonB-dependent receptor plug domain-containing protein [Saccharobesus litoralis]AWB65833.1 TonB-dependent receptor [Saccharobesus litoralis]